MLFKYLLIVISVAIALSIAGCSSQNYEFGFGSGGDCDKVYSDCISRCKNSDMTRTECYNSCDKTRAMCRAMQVKGCMQNCNTKYGKDTPKAESCKKKCKD